MALTYRTPMEDIVSAFEPSAQSAIASTAVLGYKNIEEELFQFFNYSLPPQAKKNLSKAGIYLSPYSAMLHSHPVCKTLENNLLYRVLPSYIDSSFYFVGIKNFKLTLLKRRHKHLDMIKTINRYVTSTDLVRYTHDFVQYFTHPHESLKRHQFALDGATLRELVPPIKRYKARKLFLHDELHYWKFSDLCVFLEVIKPEVMLASVVYPPEILRGAKKSLNPWCYEFEIIGGDIMYYPDGVRSEGYQQPLNGGYLLECNKIELADGEIYSVDLITSHFSHHLFALTKCDRPNATYRSFGPFDATSCTGLSKLCPEAQYFLPVHFDVISRVYRYLRTLKKPDPQSAMAKLSQIVADPTGDEMKVMQDFAALVIGTDAVRSVILPESLKLFFSTYLGWLPDVCARLFKSVREVSLDNFIKWLKPFTVDVHLRKMTACEEFCITYPVLAECEEGVDLPGLIDDKFVKGGQKEVFSHTPSPYIGIRCAEPGESSQPLLTLCRVQLKKMVLHYIMRSHMSPTVKNLNVKKLRGILSWLGGKLWDLGFRESVVGLFGNCTTQDLLDMVERRYYRLREFVYQELGPAWFFEPRAGNTRYLCSHPDGSNFFRDVRCKWSAVVGDVLVERPKLKRTRNARAYSYLFKTPTVIEVLEQKTLSEGGKEGPEVVERAPQTPANELTFCCSCGVELPSHSLEVLDHAFVAPDELRGRKAGWYSAPGVDYNYRGGSHQSLGWPVWLSEWCAVNNVDQKYNCCLYQVYREGAKIGFHADDEEIFAPGESILTINLSGEARFLVKCGAGSGAFFLQPGQAFTMPAGFQNSHKHAVNNCTEMRASVTFRVLQPDLGDTLGATDTEIANEPAPRRIKLQKTVTSDEGDISPHLGPESGACSAREIIEDYGAIRIVTRQQEEKMHYFTQTVMGDGNCFWYCMGEHLGLAWRVVKQNALSATCGTPAWFEEVELMRRENEYTQTSGIALASMYFKIKICVYDVENRTVTTFTTSDDVDVVHLELLREHFSIMVPKNKCALDAIAKALDRPVRDVVDVLERNTEYNYSEEIWKGEGFDLVDFETMLGLFNIRGLIVRGNDTLELNEKGQKVAEFKAEGGHITYLGPCKLPVHSVTNSRRESELFPRSAIDEFAGAGTKMEYVTDICRAKILADSFNQGSTGVLLSSLFNGAPNLSTRFQGDDSRTYDLFCIVGTFGAGKSTLFKRLLKQGKGKAFDYVSPRRSLALEFQHDVGIVGRKKQPGQQLWRVSTFETFLSRCHLLRPGQILVLDEMQLYPPGYFDLVLQLIPDGVVIFLVGDPCQSDYDSEKDRCILGHLPGNMQRVLGNLEYKYVVKSRRFRNANFIGRLPCTIPAENCTLNEPYLLMSGVENIAVIPKEFQEVFLVSSFEEKKMVCAYSPTAKVMTFGESTGLNFKNGTIVISGVSKSTNELRWLTALSRFSHNICFLDCTGYGFESLRLAYEKRALAKFFCATASHKDLLQLLPGKPSLVESFLPKMGRDEGVREEKLQGDPWLKTMVDLLQIEDMDVPEIGEEVMQEEWFKTHLPREELESVRAQWVHKILLKESREKRIGHLVSEQFTDEHSNQSGAKLTNSAERFETIYPRHRANDTVTFLMAVKKRLRFSRPAVEKAKLFEASNFGRFLLKEFLAKVPLKPAHNPQMMATAKMEFEEKKTSKSAAIIENHSNRSCRDWLADVGMIFSKSQLCTKFDNRFRDAKAAQSIVCFQHSVLCRFAPYMRYIEKKLHEVLPPNFYIHSGKGLDELNSWVRKGQFEGVCTESDYEAFDASQDHYIVAFEVEIMKYLGLPHDLIADYLYIKTHLGSKLGSFAIMRFSGEASTFLFNTMANMLFTFLRYQLNGDEFICFAGDDMCASRRLPVKREHEGFLGKLKLKAKVQFTTKPTFCGWHLCSDGIYKKPQLVMERMCIAKELNNLHNCIDNYAIEVAFAYRMGERAVNRMDAEELGAFYNCVRIIIKNKHLLRSNVRDVFEKAADSL